MATDWNAFIRESDPKVQGDFEKPTKDKIQAMHNTFRRLLRFPPTLDFPAKFVIGSQAILIH
jgi:hypothetical protein